jgi:solute carrier family 38 (sodium-coupled neutral amino acid transporter), member 11
MNSNFLTNYSSSDSLVNFMRVMFAITQILTYPLELFVARHSVHALFFASEKKFTDQLHYTITLLLWGSSLAIALNVSELGVVLELTGGVSAVFIGFVMPAMLTFKMSGYNWRLWLNPPEKRAEAAKMILPAIWLLVFGIMAMVFTLIFVAASFAAGGHGPHDAFDDPTGTGAHGVALLNATDDNSGWNPSWGS